MTKFDDSLTDPFSRYPEAPRTQEFIDRFNAMMMTRALYAEFEDFARDMMALQGFQITWMQRSIARFMQHGGRRIFVGAQRGEAKSTVAAYFIIWSLIFKPEARCLLFSAGEKQAKQLAFLVVQTIETVPALWFLRPDRPRLKQKAMEEGGRSRASVEEWDVYLHFKGRDKSPSVSFMQVRGTLPGFRADVLLADDIESQSNTRTPLSRESVELAMREFTNICSRGTILYLGTFQHKNSVYRMLPSMGYTVRLWPGRFPTQETLPHYTGFLAPEIMNALVEHPEYMKGGGALGRRGRVTDPDMFNEALHQEKEESLGPEGYELHFLLDPTLSAEAQQELHVRDFIVASWPHDFIPEGVRWTQDPQYRYTLPPQHPLHSMGASAPAMFLGQTYLGAQVKPDAPIMMIDPAGKGADEMTWCVGRVHGDAVHILSVEGARGGLSDQNARRILGTARKWGVKVIHVETNMGEGLFEQNLRRLLLDDGQVDVSVASHRSTGQKEVRICQTLGPMLRQHRLVIYPEAILSDAEDCKPYSPAERHIRSVLYQIENITMERGALPHDDRVDCLAMLVMILGKRADADVLKEAEEKEAQKVKAFLDDPMGYLEQLGHNPTRKRRTRWLGGKSRM